MVLKSPVEKTAFLESIILSAPLAMVVLDENLNIALMNPRAHSYLSTGQEAKGNVLGKPLLDFAPAPFRQKLSEKLEAGQLNFDFPETKLGQRHVTVRCRPVPGGSLLTFMNISKLKEMEITAYNAMLEGQESERRRFAQEMHDGIGPLLSALKLNIEHLQSQEQALDPETTTRFETVISMIDQVTQDVRSISHSLMPAALVDFGFDSALQQLCTRVSLKGKLQVNFYSTAPGKRFEPVTELGLYRIGQELLNNALKHAAAKEITVQIIHHEKSIVLMVEDDGQGFDQKELKATLQGIGLRYIQTRVKSLHGHFTLESSPGEGVLASVEVPI